MTYRDEVLRTANAGNTSWEGQLGMAGMGLAGEAGEVCDLLKKVIFHNKDLDRDKLVKELGDVRWYLEYLMITTDITMKEVEETNVAKLRARYPTGFNIQDANNRRDEDVETSIVEIDTKVSNTNT